MSALAKGVLVARILEHVPIPFVPQAAEAFDDLVTALHTEHGIDVTDLRSAIVAAREPWERIHTAAVASAAQLGVHAGSTGE